VGAAGRARLLVTRVLVEQQRQHVARGRLGQVLHEQDVVRRRLAARARAALRRPAAGLQAARAPGASRPPRLLRGWGGTWNDKIESHGAVEHKGVSVPAGPHWVLAPALPPCAAAFAICVAALATTQARSQAATSAVSGATTACCDAGWGWSPAEPRPAPEPPPWSCSGSSASLRAPAHRSSSAATGPGTGTHAGVFANSTLEEKPLKPSRTSVGLLGVP